MDRRELIKDTTKLRSPDHALKKIKKCEETFWGVGLDAGIKKKKAGSVKVGDSGKVCESGK